MNLNFFPFIVHQKVRCAETEKKKCQEERDVFSAKNAALKAEFRDLERVVQDAKDEASNYRTQMKYLRAEKTRYDKAREETQAAKEKLQLYESIDLIVKGTIGEVNDRLHDIGDFSKTARELSIIIVALKKEMKAQGEDRHALKAEMRAKCAKISELKSALVTKSRDLAELQQVNRTLSSDLQHAEEEKDTLKVKVNWLQQAMDSPSGDVRQSALNRVITENPAPCLFAGLSDSDDDDNGEKPKKKTDSPFLKTKSCSIVGLNKRKVSPCKDSTNVISGFNIMKKSRFAAAGLSQEAALKGPAAAVSKNKSGEKFYDGLGGHSKPDIFPSGRANPGSQATGAVGKKPKGVAKRPKVGGAAASSRDKNIKAINKYFNFDTP